MIKVLIADDQSLVRGGLAMIIGAQPDLEVVGEAADGAEAVALAARLAPDVVLMDIRMPGIDGLQATEQLMATGADLRVLVLTTFDLDEYVYAAIRAGASGFLVKDIPPAELVRGVRTVVAGEALIAPSVLRRLLDAFVRRPPPGSSPRRALAALTERELEVFTLLGRGFSNAEIAAALFVGENTVKTHIAHLMQKLQLRDRVHAVITAYECGLIVPGQD